MLDSTYKRFKGLSIGALVTILTTGLHPNLDSTNITQQTESNSSFISIVDDEIDIELLIKNMTTREKVAQLMVIWARGRFESTDNEYFKRIARIIEKEQIGGIIFSSGDIYGQAHLTNRFQQLSQIPLWISQDMETGAAMRIAGTTRFTPAMGVAATGNPQYAYEIGRVTAQESKALGVHQIFAPVLDVNNNPANPVINTRSYSENPYEVADFAEAFVKGAQDHGTIATGKHFPGHGDTSIDSHLALPTITHDYARLDSIELVPYKRVIQAGIKSIMSAHIAFPEIGQSANLPGTLDANILTGLLKDTLGFTGLIVSDALEMSAISRNFSPGDAAVRALDAGIDMLLLPNNLVSAIDAVEKAVEEGKIRMDTLDAAVRKILQLKVEYGVFKQHSIDIESLPGIINPLESRLLSAKIARESITLLRNENDIIPIRPDRFPRVTVIAISDNNNANTGSTFARSIREYHPAVSFYLMDLRTSKEEIDIIIRNARQSDLIIIGTFVYVRTSNDIELTGRQKQFIQKITDLKKPLVVSSFGNPYAVRDIPRAGVHLLAWASTDQQMEAAAHAIFGASSVSGKLPVTIPPFYKYGHGLTIDKSILRVDHPAVTTMNIDSLRVIEDIMQEAIKNKTFPGGVVTVIKDDIIVYQNAHGYHDYNKMNPVQTTDVFDLASISKILGTTLGVMKLIDDGKLSLDDRISSFFSEFDTPEKKDITIYQMLTHVSGLPAFRVYVDEIKDKKSLVQAILNEPLINKPGQEYVYSDLGIIITGLVIEKISGQSLDVFMDRNFYAPMGMNMTTYNPMKRGNWYTSRILPTEIDTIYRHKLIQGEVHDERAYYLEGVAGHAGLFSNAPDIAKFSSMLLNKGLYGGKRFLNEHTIESFIKRQQPLNRRGIGFDMKSIEGFSSAGTKTSINSYGHTGFTGTSLWIDPDRATAIIILTNRTFPYRGTSLGVSQVRSNIADIVIGSISK